jgi:quercetin dioxygenase-like cupin family protein
MIDGYVRPEIVRQAKKVVEMITNGSNINDIVMPIDNFFKWKSIDGIASKGVKMMSMCVKDNIVTLQVYFPKNSEVKMHYHKDERETITVLIGTVNYKISDITDNIIKIGTLKRFEQLSIEPGDKHLIFTTNDKAFIMVDLIKQKL